MLDVLCALLAGLVFGGFFTLVKLPLPAPPSLAGIAGIVGVYLGYVAVSYITK